MTDTPANLHARFASKVERHGAHMLWKGAVDHRGHGFMRSTEPNRFCRAHRVAWALAYGDWPTRRIVNICGNILCCTATHWKEAKTEEQARERTPGFCDLEAKRRNKYKYNISIEEYERMYEEQDGRCAICRLPEVVQSRRLSVDHDHQTGNIRGLLCFKCNTGLGNFGDSYVSILKAAEYLKRSQ